MADGRRSAFCWVVGATVLGIAIVRAIFGNRIGPSAVELCISRRPIWRRRDHTQHAQRRLRRHARRRRGVAHREFIRLAGFAVRPRDQEARGVLRFGAAHPRGPLGALGLRRFFGFRLRRLRYDPVEAHARDGCRLHVRRVELARRSEHDPRDLLLSARGDQALGTSATKIEGPHGAALPCCCSAPCARDAASIARCVSVSSWTSTSAVMPRS